MDHTTVEVPRLPICDFCAMDPEPPIPLAEYDGKTKAGPWANMCSGHFEEHGVGLGLGRGQRLILSR